MDYGDVVNKVFSEEVRQKDAAAIAEQTAMLARGKPQKKRKQGKRYPAKQKETRVYFTCGKARHLQRDCRSNKKTDESHIAFHATVGGGASDASWVVDSGASTHMSGDRRAFATYTPATTVREVSVAKAGVILRVLGSGSIDVLLQLADGARRATLYDVLHVEGLSRNLFSVSAVTKKGMCVTLNARGCVITSKGVVVGTGTAVGSLVYLDIAKDSCHLAQVGVTLIHRRMGHASIPAVTKLVKTGVFGPSIDTRVASAPYEVCQTAKQSCKSFPSHTDEHDDTKYTDSMVCSDVMGPITPSTNRGFKYVVTFTLMKSKYLMVYPLRTKGDVLVKFAEFCRTMKTDAGITVTLLRSDNGGKYRNGAMKEFCALFPAAECEKREGSMGRPKAIL